MFYTLNINGNYNNVFYTLNINGNYSNVLYVLNFANYIIYFILYKALVSIVVPC